MNRFPFVHQKDAMDCGPSCLAMITQFYGKAFSLPNLRKRCFITREGVSMLGVSDAAESIGMRTSGVRTSFDRLVSDARLPLIAHWQQRHFIVVYRIDQKRVWIADPAHGLARFSHEEFIAGWTSTKRDGEEQGLCLLLEPAPDFYAQEGEMIDKANLAFLFQYLRPYKKYLVQLTLGLGLGAILQAIFPYLTQAIVDKGINNRDIDFVYLILIAQLMLFASQTAVDFIRSWILLHISTRINISLISDFLIKLLKLPIGYFDSKLVGDIIQRIQDHERIESFLTGSTLNIVFSMFSLIVFGVILATYDLTIFSIFIIASVLYVIWVTLFMKMRRQLDHRRFAQMSANQSNLYELVTGIQEIKLNNCEKQKRWDWERIQALLFKVRIKGLALSQYQQSGSIFVNQVKNILLSFFAAKAVIDGNMTLGQMMAVQYIIGQLNSPIDQMINFFHSYQDAKISLERLAEVHQLTDEVQNSDFQRSASLPQNHSIVLRKISFQYEGPRSEFVLKDIDLEIPEGKTTAVVGVSGSGKTTLIKLLLGFYPPVRGDIQVGDVGLKNINPVIWRTHCGVVMQEGFIFSDKIANNIAVGVEEIDYVRLKKAAQVANIDDDINSLPLRYDTKIGMEGSGLSQGQKQRILIARCVYKDPQYIFFDEATNSLDSNNERAIMNHLEKFLSGRTAVIVAHRLSTVRNAHQIVVLDKGEIVEIGNHDELTEKRGHYYQLVKNQLELGT